MKKIKFIPTILILVFLPFFLFAKEVNENRWCPISGLEFSKNLKTSLYTNLHNGLQRQYCSLYSLVKDYNDYGIDFSSIKVFDNVTKKHLNTTKLYFVYGSLIRGAVYNKAFFAFSTLGIAKSFQDQYGGEVLDFKQSFEKAKKDYKKVDEYQNNVKQKLFYPQGKRIFTALCKQNIDVTDYLEINELKADIVNLKFCKKMDESHLHAVSNYLWLNTYKVLTDTLKVGEKERCPVCAMFVAKYPKWVAQIFYKKDGKTVHLSFDGVKDMMKFYFNPKKWGYPDLNYNKFEKVMVTDYYSTSAINAKDAFFVIGSDTYGPMGHELIPFKTEKEADTFKRDHLGTKIVSFNQIIEEEVYKLDEL